MLKISVDFQIPFPRSLVYATYRDELVELGLSLPNVKSLELKSHQKINQQVYLEIEWHGGGNIPNAARKLLSKSLFDWTEYDVWNNQTFTVDWHIRTHAYQEAISLSGQNRFLDQGDRTLVKNRGLLQVDLSAIHGVPSFTRNQMVSWIEKLLAKRIEPNLIQMGRNVESYLEQIRQS
ncbi:hypothetical protein AWQ21_15595 (plasmid) [Picosynechococcus sp. PCC 7003]|uniref:hypothetical protein n=1 Tax=Picosynechococcus sp. PCC 7003 TaxID=374981 RepID=UPI000810CCB9|nr:hypothetical protein [Picosynechococcus sp. PCC 7003]ANV85945.1 hypothetical protein AWQ21_15595 [Picosynechococcus sp. PCC 7003]